MFSAKIIIRSCLYLIVITLVLPCFCSTSFSNENNISRMQIILAWNRYSYNLLKSKLQPSTATNIMSNHVRVGEYFRYKNTYITHPFYKCANHGITGIPINCMSFLTYLIEKVHPKLIISLQTVGIAHAKPTDLLTMFQVNSIYFQKKCYPTPNQQATQLAAAVVYHSRRYIGSGLKKSYCHQSHVLIDSNSLSFPLVFAQLSITNFPKVLIIAGVTDLDTKQAAKSHAEYLLLKEKMAHIMTNYVMHYYIIKN